MSLTPPPRSWRLPSSALGLLCAAAVTLSAAGCEEEPAEEREVSTVTTRFDASLADDWWSFPFPHDARRTENFRPDFTDFPNPSDNALLEEYKLASTEQLDGFGTNSPIYFTFSDSIVLPEQTDAAVAASARCEGPLRLVSVSPSSPDYGTCVPLRWQWIGPDTVDPYVAPNMLIMAPYWGFPLRSGAQYAAFVVDVQDDSGAYLQGPAPLQSLLADSSSDATMQQHYAGLATWLEIFPDAAPAGLEWIAAATVFTTQNVVREMNLLADRVLNDDDLPSWNGDLELLPEDHAVWSQEYDTYTGSYQAHNFQEGTIPYQTEGGGFVWQNGAPVPQMEERIPFALGTPRVSFEQPAEGWPVMIQAHGTGGDRFSHFGGGNLRPALLAASRGFVSIGIPQPIHGERWPEGTETAISLYSFNYFNPPAGRSTFRQGALDLIALVKFIREHMAEGGDFALAHPELRVNPEAIYLLGHSQGGLTGGLALPFMEGLKGAVLSGAGGGLSITMMQREDPFPIRDALATGIGAPEGTELSVMHPVLGLVQALAETTDPVNYAPQWFAESDREPISILLTEGMRDAQTPADTSETLAIAARLPIVLPYKERDVLGLELRRVEAIDSPYTANALHPTGAEVTTGLAQFDANHFAIFNEGDAALLWANFMWSMVDDGAPGELGGAFP